MWLLEAGIKHNIESAEKTGFTPTAEHMPVLRSDDIMTVAGTEAQINVIGILTSAPSFMAQFFGGGNTTYIAIQAALATADADQAVEKITMFVDSPGGNAHGLFECLAAIQGTEKPIQVISSRACSAAYAIAAVAGPIRATSVGSMFGCIGVAIDAFVSDDEISITSSKAPRKRPDMTTEEGVAIVREELDALHDLFVGAIADGRGVSADDVNASFGEGSTLLSGEALTRGMIDSINIAKSGNSEELQEVRAKMDVQTLKANHYDVYTAVRQKGVAEERDRVTAHLTMGEASGAMKTAIDAISDGSAMTATLQAKYLAAGMDRSDVRARQEDDKDADGADNLSSSGPDAEEAAGAAILAQAAENLGVELGVAGG